jgi:hypothetical protein
MRRAQVAIASAHLLPSLLAEHGLGPTLVAFPPGIVSHIITGAC